MFRLFDFDKAVLVKALQNTCNARNFELTGEMPVGLTKTFSEDPAKNNLWNGFSKRAGLTIPVGSLREVVVELRKNLLPMLDMIGKSPR